MSRGRNGFSERSLLRPKDEPDRYVTRSFLQDVMVARARVQKNMIVAWHREYIEPFIEWSQLPWWKRIFSTPRPTSLEPDAVPMPDVDTTETPNESEKL